MKDIVEKVLKTIKENKMTNKGDTVICGLSGGPDSVCMVYILHLLKDELKINPVAVHVNHMIRGADADMDMMFSEKFAKSLDMPFYGRCVDVPALAGKLKISEEEAGRNVRYDFFRDIARKYTSYKIATAHNSNDVVETFLFNLARGSGIEGLCGIKKINGDVIRPVLSLSKKEILGYLEYNNIEYRIDKTNEQNNYTRNKIRNVVIPLINKELNTDLEIKILNTVSLLTDDYDYLKEQSKKAYEECLQYTKDQPVINCNALKSYPISLRRTIIRMHIKETLGSLDGITGFHINRTVELADNLNVPGSHELPKGYIATVRYKTLKISKKKALEQTDVCVVLNIPGTTFVSGKGWEIKAEIINKNKKVNYKEISNKNTQFFDYEKVTGTIYIRNKNEGDVFKPFGFNGTKKLKDLFIDEKIERENRDMIPLIVGNEGILWVIGYKRAKFAPIVETTEKVLKLTFKGGIYA